MSDHLAITFDVKTSTVLENPLGSIPCYSRANWPRFMSYITRKIDLSNVSLDTIQSTTQIDVMVEHLTSTTVEAKELSNQILHHISTNLS
jgi:hypothetical protein